MVSVGDTKVRPKPNTTVDGAILTEARVRANLGVRELARLIGCNGATICRWEQGKAHPDSDMQARLVAILWPEGFVVGVEKALDGKGRWKWPGGKLPSSHRVVRKMQEGRNERGVAPGNGFCGHVHGFQ